jgi:hypothetical protein
MLAFPLLGVLLLHQASVGCAHRTSRSNALLVPPRERVETLLPCTLSIEGRMDAEEGKELGRRREDALNVDRRIKETL